MQRDPKTVERRPTLRRGARALDCVVITGYHGQHGQQREHGWTGGAHGRAVLVGRNNQGGGPGDPLPSRWKRGQPLPPRTDDGNIFPGKAGRILPGAKARGAVRFDTTQVRVIGPRRLQYGAGPSAACVQDCLIDAAERDQAWRAWKGVFPSLIFSLLQGGLPLPCFLVVVDSRPFRGVHHREAPGFYGFSTPPTSRP